MDDKKSGWWYNLEKYKEGGYEEFFDNFISGMVRCT